jgi:hypothetical protein
MRAFANLLSESEENRVAGAVLVGMLRERRASPTMRGVIDSAERGAWTPRMAPRAAEELAEGWPEGRVDVGCDFALPRVSPSQRSIDEDSPPPFGASS